jgi:hypothetical protein
MLLEGTEVAMVFDQVLLHRRFGIANTESLTLIYLQSSCAFLDTKLQCCEAASF